VLNAGFVGHLSMHAAAVYVLRQTREEVVVPCVAVSGGFFEFRGGDVMLHSGTLVFPLREAEVGTYVEYIAEMPCRCDGDAWR
jgi:hypothetical protein